MQSSNRTTRTTNCQFSCKFVKIPIFPGKSPICSCKSPFFLAPKNAIAKFFRPNKSSRPVLFLARSWGGPQRTNGKPRVFRSNTFLVSSILCSICFRVFFHRGGGGVLLCFRFLRKKTMGFQVCGCFFALLGSQNAIFKKKNNNPHTPPPRKPENPSGIWFLPLFFFGEIRLSGSASGGSDWPTWRSRKAEKSHWGALRGEPTTLPENKKNDDCWEIFEWVNVFICEKWGWSNLILVFRHVNSSIFQSLIFRLRTCR